MDDNQQQNVPNQPSEPIQPLIPAAQPAPVDPTTPVEPVAEPAVTPIPEPVISMPEPAALSQVETVNAEPAAAVPQPAAPTTEPIATTESVPTPIVEPAAPAASPAPTAPPSNQLKRLLLVEDDDSLANVYVMRLQTEGFDVRRVANGEEALAAALNYHPDLIILDAMMPKVSGFDVLDILRNTPETANVKIVMLTALSQDSDKERAESLGVDDYLVKSQVVIADVIDRIRHHLNMQ